jgi:hypothetical protein
MSKTTPEQSISAALHEEQLLDSEVHLAQLALAACHDEALHLSSAIAEQRKRRAAYMSRFEDGCVLPSPPPTRRPRHG